MKPLHVEDALKDYRNCMATELKKWFENRMDSLTGYPNNEAVRKIAQKFLEEYIKEMKSLGWKTRKWNTPNVSIRFGIFHVPIVEFEY